MSLIKVTGTSNIKSVIGINSNVKYTKIVGINTNNVYWKAGIEAWQSAEVYVTGGGNVGIRVFDLDGNPMSGVSYSFTVKYTLYENNKSKKSDTKTAEPNYPSGNIAISTGVEVAKGKSYYAKVEVVDAKEKYMDWDGTTESKVLFDGVLIGDSVDGASAKVVGTSAILSFTSSASNVVQVIIQRRKSGGTSSDWVDWRNYYIFPADGNQSKATMLINNNTSWSVTTAAWYSKSGYNYSVEWSLGDSEYYVKYIYGDSSAAEDYDVYDISPKTVEYNGMSQFVFNGNGNYMPGYNGNVIDVGTYTVTITRLKDNVVFLYNGEYTRLKSSYTTYLYIKKRVVDCPRAIQNLEYNGANQTGITNIDSSWVNITGHTGKNAGYYTAIATLKDNENTVWNTTPQSTGSYTVSWSISKATITSSDIIVIMGKTSDKYVRAKVTCGFTGLTYNGKFRRKSDDKLGGAKTGSTGNWVESSWKIDGEESYGFRVYSITGNSNINGWSGDKGANSWYSG